MPPRKPLPPSPPATRTPAKAAADTRQLMRSRGPRTPFIPIEGTPQPLGDAEVAEVFRRLELEEPEPKGELEHLNPFTLLVAVVLSAQATDAGVNKATRPLFAIADTPERMLALGEDAVRQAIKSIGLFRNKARNVILLSEQLIALHGGVVPADRDLLTALPGVGRKTANVVLNMAFGQPTMAVDTHVFRVSNRLPIAPGSTPEAVEEGLMARVPARYGLHAHHWLILHGRYTCKARAPECWRCRLVDLCRAPEKPAALARGPVAGASEDAESDIQTEP